MAYLNGPASTTEFGVVEIGNNIVITDGIISLEQDVAPTANVNFASVTSMQIYQGSNQVIDTVTPTVGPGISVTGVTTGGPAATFKINNTGVLSLSAGPGITLSANTGNITVSSTGADFLNTVGTGASYTATATDEYIGVTTSSAVTITLPAGTDGRVYTVKDELGGSPKITVAGTGTDKIDGANTKSITVPYSSITVVFRAGQWRII
jgi:hypothetical protein